MTRSVALPLWAAVAVGFTVRSAAAGPPAELLPPRLRPLSEAGVPILPWEQSSTSPFGGMRLGGEDRRTFAHSPDGRLLATQDAGGWQLELWDVAAGKSLGRFGRLGDPVALAFSPDGQTLVSAAASGHDSSAVELWDVAQRARVRGLDEDVNLTPFTAVAVSPDGKTLALGAGRGARTGRGRGPAAAAVHLWDLGTGDEIRRLAAPPGPANPQGQARVFDCLAFSPDGRTLGLVSDGRVYLWEVATGAERCQLGTLPGMDHPVRRDDPAAAAAAFSPDGRTLAVSCADGLVRLWDVLTGAELAPLAGHPGGAVAVRFSADGKALWTFGRDYRARTWPAAEAARPWQPTADRLAARALAALWDALAEDDPFAREGAVRVLAAHPDQAVPLVRERVKPVPVADGLQVAGLVAELAKDDFNARKRAAAALRQNADLAIPALRAAVQAQRAEATRAVLQRLEAGYPTREQARDLQALRVLERAGTPAAERLVKDLAAGAPESLFTRQARAAAARFPAAKPAEAPAPDALWAELGQADAARAFRAIQAAVAGPKAAVPALAERLRAAAGGPDDDPDRLARLIGDLDSDQFQVRARATQELSRLGRLAEPALRAALAGKLSAEARARVEGLLQGLPAPAPDPDRLQADRALEALERIGTDDARRALADLARDAKSRWVQAAAARSSAKR
jgi:hypothetical protein